MKYLVLRLIDGDEAWSFVNTMDALWEAQDVASNDAIRHGSNFHDAVSYWSDETKYMSNWKSRWTRQTTDDRIFYEIIGINQLLT